MFCVGCSRELSGYSCRLSRSGGQQCVESGYAALSHDRDIHTTHYRRLSRRAKMPGKVTEVAVFIDGASSSEDETWRFVEQLLCLVVKRLVASSGPVGVRENNVICIRPGYCCDAPFGITLVEDIEQIGMHQITNRFGHSILSFLAPAFLCC